MSLLKKHISFLSILAHLLLTAFITVQKPVLFKPTTFYVAGVLDQRATKGNESALVTRFIEDALPKNFSLKPVEIEIKEITIAETTGKIGMVNGEIKMQLSFSLLEMYGKQHLLNYSGIIRYSRLSSNTRVTDQNLKTLAKSALVYFNTWMNRNINTSRVLASGVKVSFDYYKEKIEGDTIYYAKNRPLNWTDFKSTKKISNKYAAMVMPNIGYDQREEIVEGVIHVTITLKTYLAKSDCWLSSPYKADYILNHEQRHFDIAKIITEQFRKKILAADLTPENYEAFINMQYLDSYREMNNLQEDYDTDTAHGTNSLAQQNWNKRIDALMFEAQNLR